jgi:hypothetical protein
MRRKSDSGRIGKACLLQILPSTMKNPHFYLLKLARLSGWLLLPLVLTYILTGFAISGEFGLNGWMHAETARDVHRFFEWPLIVLFALHATTTAYFSLRRWGWIKNRTKTGRCPDETR